jgi:hypothetical protein
MQAACSAPSSRSGPGWSLVRGALCVLMAGLGVALAGCGEGADPPATGASEAAKPAARRATPDPTEQQIREVANAYLKALSRRDWTAACATLAESEQRYLERLGKGRCERVFRDGGRRADKGVRRLLGNSLASEIRIGREQAVIGITEAGGRDVYMRLHAIEEDGRWGIARSRKRRDRFPLESLSPPVRKRG